MQHILSIYLKKITILYYSILLLFTKISDLYYLFKTFIKKNIGFIQKALKCDIKGFSGINKYFLINFIKIFMLKYANYHCTQVLILQKNAIQ